MLSSEAELGKPSAHRNRSTGDRVLRVFKKVRLWNCVCPIRVCFRAHRLGSAFEGAVLSGSGGWALHKKMFLVERHIARVNSPD